MVRVKQRYVVAEIVQSVDAGKYLKFKENDLYKTVKDSILKCHGECGWEVVQDSFKVKYLNAYTHICLIRTKRDFHKILLDSIPYITKIANHSLSLKILHLGGSIRSCEKFIARHHFWSLPKLLRQCDSIEHQEELKKSFDQTALRLS